jgi:hypothetical protein
MGFCSKVCVCEYYIDLNCSLSLSASMCCGDEG